MHPSSVAAAFVVCFAVLPHSQAFLSPPSTLATTWRHAQRSEGGFSASHQRQPGHGRGACLSFRGLTMASSPAIDNLLGRVKGPDGISRLGGKDQEVEKWLSGAAEMNPTTDPGDWADDDKAKNLAEGVWEVAYAPHIHTMQKILGVEFAPIRYSLYARPGGGRVMISNVHYKGPIVGEGWLNTAGGWVSLDKKTVRVTWSKFWWDAGASLEAGPSAAPEGEAAGLVQVKSPWTPTQNIRRALQRLFASG
jgi:hypothetical protein